MKLPTLSFLAMLLGSSTAHPSPSTRRSLPTYKLSHIPITGPLPQAGSKSAFSALASSPESQKAGARLAGSGLTTASAIFTIPAAEMPTTGPTANNQNGIYQASYWVGIDGVSSCPGASLRAGVDTFWDTGMRTTAAWFEWYPSTPTEYFANFTVVQGDVVRVSATAGEDGTGGSVTVEKLDGTGCEAKVLASVTRTFEGKTGGDRLCLSEAAWVVEDYPLASLPEIPLALANFTEVQFSKMGAGTAGGKVPLTGLEVFDINLQAQGGQLADCEVGSDGVSVDCKRVVGGV